METKKSRRIGLTDLILLIVSAAYPILILTLFRACGPKEDGSFMNCHWAHRAVVLFALLLAVLSVVHMIFGDPGRKQGISAAMLLTAGASMIVPGRIIDLCMMADMRCRSVMAPGTYVLSVLVMAAAVMDLVVQAVRGRRGGAK